MNNVHGEKNLNPNWQRDLADLGMFLGVLFHGISLVFWYAFDFPHVGLICGNLVLLLPIFFGSGRMKLFAALFLLLTMLLFPIN